MPKKKKLNSKNPKYRTQAEIQAKTKAVDKKVFIAESNGAKVYAVFYKQQGKGGSAGDVQVLAV